MTDDERAAARNAIDAIHRAALALQTARAALETLDRCHDCGMPHTAEHECERRD